MGEGEKKGRRFSPSALFLFHFHLSPFLPGTPESQATKKTYEQYSVLEPCTQAPSFFARHAEILLQVERPLYKNLRILSVEENNLRPRVVSWTLVRSRQL